MRVFLGKQYICDLLGRRPRFPALHDADMTASLAALTCVFAGREVALHFEFLAVGACPGSTLSATTSPEGRRTHNLDTLAPLTPPTLIPTSSSLPSDSLSLTGARFLLFGVVFCWGFAGGVYVGAGCCCWCCWKLDPG